LTPFGKGGRVIENEFRKEILDDLKKRDADYADWMTAIKYEVERRPTR